MKKTINFSKGFPVAIVFSALLLIACILGFFVRGFNLGVDFNAGLIQEIRIGDPAASVTYNGPSAVTLSLAGDRVDVVVTGVSIDNVTHVFQFAEYPTAGDIVAALNQIDGVTANVSVPSAPAASLFVDAETLPRLGAVPYFLFWTDESAAVIPVDDVRSALAHIPGVTVQNIGSATNGLFQIRVADDGTNPQASTELRSLVSDGLDKAFGANRTAVLKTDFVGAALSHNLGGQVFMLLFFTFALIFLYVMFRFRWDMALAGIIALIHDCIVMCGVVIWFRIEVNTTVIAALLTIIGYSINDTIVIYDRIRENSRILGNIPFTQILNCSLSDTLSRTILTSVTTLLAVVSLFIATTGAMKDFALILIVGIICGTYTTMFITSAFINLTRRFIKDKTSKVPASADEVTV